MRQTIIFLAFLGLVGMLGQANAQIGGIGTGGMSSGLLNIGALSFAAYVICRKAAHELCSDTCPSETTQATCEDHEKCEFLAADALATGSPQQCACKEISF